ncbi:MAG: PTS sugar transporter subunit IIA [Planctomycetota bacterium]|jgi:mannitol/fructose-specific phosphotransferase system IIA component (Ntr-type)
MKITDILTTNCVRVPLNATEKIAAITELVDLLDANGQLDDRDQVLDSVLKREETRSTGIGRRLAVPHGKSAGCKNLVIALGKPATPIDFESPDGRPCNIIVLLASPIDKTGPHIQALAGISRMWQTESFRAKVAQAQTSDDLLAAIKYHEG